MPTKIITNVTKKLTGHLGSLEIKKVLDVSASLHVNENYVLLDFFLNYSFIFKWIKTKL